MVSTGITHDVVPFQGRFPSWEAFDVARKAHCEKTYTMYVCRNTVKVAVANKRRKLQVPDIWVYDRKIYVCTHGYKRVSRSGGSRPRQNVRYTDCKARFTACVASEVPEDGREVLFVQVTGQHLVHTDHPVTLEQWRMYSQNRAAVIEHPYLTHEAELMRRIGSNKRAAREHIETLTGKVCTMKDMHNVYARLKKREKSAHPEDTTRSELQSTSVGSSLEFRRATNLLSSGVSSQRVEPVLQSFVDADVENHVSILSGDDGSNEAICLASRAMKEHFQAFPELLVVDVAMATQPDVPVRQLLHGLLSMDALGNAKPVFVARSLAMSSSLLRRMCQDFKRTHPTWEETKVLVMNRVMPDVIDVLKHEFPRAQALLCQFHVLQLLNDQLADSQQQPRPRIQSARVPAPNIRRVISGQDDLHQSLQQLVFARSESRYNEAKALLVRQQSTEFRTEWITMFERHWEPYRALWVSYTRSEQFDFSSFFTRGMSSFWEPMKNAFNRTRDSHLSAVATATGDSHSTTATASIHQPVSNLPFQGGENAADSQVNLQSSSALGAVPLTMALRGVDSLRTTGGSSLAKCTSEILTMIKFVECEWTSKMLILELTKPIAMSHCDPLLHLMVNCLSGFAVDLVSAQLSIQSARASASVTVTRTRAPKHHQSSSNSETSETSVSPGHPEATVRWLNKTTREKHILQRDGSACDCEFFLLYQLPCRHLIWYEITTLQHKQLSMAAVGPRWFLRSFQVPALSSQRESNEIEYHLL